MTQWTEERCSEEPEELQLIAPDLYIERRNIRKVEYDAVEGQEAYTGYECESREITVSEYENLKSIEQMQTEKAIDEYTAQLMEEGVI
jgi:hypothetical protein